MDDEDPKRSPEVSARFSKILFLWLIRLVIRGTKRKLTEDDVYNTIHADSASYLGNILDGYWTKELAKKAKRESYKPSLAKAQFKMFKVPYFQYGVWLFFQCLVLRLIQPLLTYKIIYYFNKFTPANVITGVITALFLIITTLLDILIFHHSILGGSRIGVRNRIATSSLIYRRLLQINFSIVNTKFTPANMIELLTVDVYNLQTMPAFIHYIWITPCQTIVSMVVAFYVAGWAPVLGYMVAIMLAIPFQALLIFQEQLAEKQLIPKTELRRKCLLSIFRNIKEIKMYACEELVLRVMKAHRRVEVKFVSRKLYILGLMTILLYFSDRVAVACQVFANLIQGDFLTSEHLYTTIQMLWTMQLEMMVFFPMALSSYFDNKRAIKKIESFLLESEASSARSAIFHGTKQQAIASIILLRVRAGWLDTSNNTYTLNDVTLTVEPKTICCIVGPEKAGKSTLLHLMMNEVPLYGGRVRVNGIISYVSQSTWLFPTSIRSNIIFGEKFERNKYKTVIRLCSLINDLKEFPYGDRTLVDVHVVLDATQRVKIKLARAMYRDADIYLIDNVFDKLNDNAANVLFDDCVLGYLKDSTRVIITGRIHILQKAQHVILVKEGRTTPVNVNKILQADLGLTGRGSTVLDKSLSIIAGDSEVFRNRYVSKQWTAMKTKYITYRDFWTYLKNDKVKKDIAFILIICLSQVFVNICDLWLMYWAKKDEYCGDDTPEPLELRINNRLINIVFDSFEFFPAVPYSPESNYTKCPREVITRNHFLIVYVILLVITWSLLAVRTWRFCRIRINISKQLFRDAFQNMLSASMEFFCSGDVDNKSAENRFSDDLYILDLVMPKSILLVILIFFMFFGVMLVIVCIAPYFIPLSIMLIYFIYKLRHWHLSSATDLIEISERKKADLMSYIDRTMQGLVTIRTFNVHNMAVDEFHKMLDLYTAPCILIMIMENMISFYADFILVIFTSILVMHFFIVPGFSYNLDSSTVGFTVTQSISLMAIVQFGLRQTAELSQYINSVIRIKEWRTLKAEFKNNLKPPTDWPSEGAIEFKKFFLYSCCENISNLISINLIIKPTEKVGVLYRNERPSLVYAMYNMFESDGVINIDGVNIFNVSIDLLRPKFTLLPADPVLFMTSIRRNVDIRGTLDDQTIWNVLDIVDLKQVIFSLDDNINDANFTTGQKYLICLARAIVLENKIVLIEDSPINMDKSTDDFYQSIIRSEFANCTIIYVTSQLSHIVDFDTLMYMDSGEILEYGTSYTLILKKRDGQIYNAFEEMEDAEKKIIKQIIEEKQRKQT